MANSGKTIDDCLGELRAAGASPIQCIKAIREVHGISLGEAKEAFACSPAWRDVQEATDREIDEALAMLESDPDVTVNP